MEISWSALGIDAPSAGDDWGLEIKLNDQVSDFQHFETTWMNTNNDTPNDPAGWRDATFRSGRTSLAVLRPAAAPSN